MSSVTDPYQPEESHRQLVRQLLVELANRDFPVSVLTKSSLVTRDIDLFKRFSECEVGFSIITLDEGVRRHFEPMASPIGDRINALRQLESSGVSTYAMIAPILPRITDGGLESLLRELSNAGVSRVLADRLNLRPNVWPSLKCSLNDYDSELVAEYMDLFFGGGDVAYYEQLKRTIGDICSRVGLEYNLCY